MNRVFGKKKAPGPPAPGLDEVSGGMGGRLGDLEAKIAKLDGELKNYRDKLKATKSPAVKKNLQKRATDILKRRRMYETQRDNLAAQQFNIDQAAFHIESAKASVETVTAMRTANAELKKQVKTKLNVDDVEDLADDMADMMEEFDEINEALGRNFATPDEIDETDLEAELEMLGDELEELDVAEDPTAADATPSYLADQLPSQPTSAPQKGSDGKNKTDQRLDEFGLPAQS